MKGYKKKAAKIMQKDFEQIKLLQSANLSTKQVHEITGWGQAVVASIYRYDSLDDYQVFLDNKYAKSKQRQLVALDLPAQNELDIAIDDWKVAFDNKLTEIDSNLVEVKMMIQSLSNNKKGFWK